MSETGIWRTMTVARVFERTETTEANVVFLESARFYRILKDNSLFDEILAALQDAAKRGTIVEIRLASLASDIIESVKSIENIR